MSHDLERLNRVLDDLAAERDVAERAALSAAEVELAAMAAFLKAADAARLRPSAAFVRRLGAHLAAARQTAEPSGSRKQTEGGGRKSEEVPLPTSDFRLPPHRCDT